MKNIQDDLMVLLRREDLLRASLILGKIHDPRFDIQAAVDEVLSIAARIWNASGPMREDSVVVCQTMRAVLYEKMGFQSNPDRNKRVIDDPQRFLLHEVLRTRMGSPLALAVLYCVLCEQVGVPHECLALPGAYLVRVFDPAGDFYVDPFDQGRMMNLAEFQRKFRSSLQRHRMVHANLFERVSKTALVSRLAQQLKQVYILKGKALEALQTVEVLKTIHPDNPELTRDRGILYCEMEYFSKAMRDLKLYLKQRPHAEDVADIKKLTSMLKGYREIVN